MSYWRAQGTATYLGYTRLELIWFLAIRLHNLGARAEHGLSATQKNTSAVTKHVSPAPNTARTLQSGCAATRSKTKPENAPRAGAAPARRTRGCRPGHRKSVPGSAGPARCKAPGAQGSGTTTPRAPRAARRASGPPGPCSRPRPPPPAGRRRPRGGKPRWAATPGPGRPGGHRAPGGR